MDNTPSNTELAGQIEALSRAVLQLSAQLEMRQLIDGPRLSQAWRGAVPDRMAADSRVLHAARRQLQSMAAALDDARQGRQIRQSALDQA